jgi:hypothetical protein
MEIRQLLLAKKNGNMFLLNFLPNWIFHVILATGFLALVASWILGSIPLISKYSIPIQFISILVIVVGIWYESGIAKDQQYLAEIADYKLKIANATAETMYVNGKVDTKIIYKVQTITEKGANVIQYVDREIVKYDIECIIPQEFVIAHNASAESKTIKEETELTK